MYCCKCKTKTKTLNYEKRVSKNNRLMGYGNCGQCGCKKTTFVGSGLANNLINNLPFELHYPGHNFLGPGTKLNKRLNDDMTPKEWSKPVDRDDAIAMRHDVCYALNKDTKTRNEICDKNMLDELKAIPNPTPAEQRHSRFASAIIGAKKRLGWGWTNELAEELHKPVQKKFRKRRVWVSGIDNIWAADLVDMTEFAKFNNGYKYLLTVIDVFSKYGWIIPLKNKTGKAVALALKTILTRRKPQYLWVDKGKEFYNKDVKSLIDLYSTENEEKSSVVERWNRTMKERMFKYFSANNTYKYIDVLKDLVKRYNETKHSSIGMTPIEASDPSNENKVRVKLYPNLPAPSKLKFAIGDRVRIPRKKRTFEKGYTVRWTEEVFTISKILYTNPTTYKLTDSGGEEIQGSFYEQELQKTSQEMYRIERVIKKKGKKALVKWLGYPDSQNSWVNLNVLERL